MHELHISPEIICGLQFDFPDFSSTWINTADSLSNSNMKRGKSFVRFREGLKL